MDNIKLSVGDYRASNSHMHSPFCPKIELVQDFMAALITCISNEDSFRTSGHFPKYVGPSRAGKLSGQKYKVGQHLTYPRF